MDFLTALFSVLPVAMKLIGAYVANRSTDADKQAKFISDIEGSIMSFNTSADISASFDAQEKRMTETKKES